MAVRYEIVGAGVAERCVCVGGVRCVCGRGCEWMRGRLYKWMGLKSQEKTHTCCYTMSQMNSNG